MGVEQGQQRAGVQQGVLDMGHVYWRYGWCTCGGRTEVLGVEISWQADSSSDTYLQQEWWEVQQHGV